MNEGRINAQREKVRSLKMSYSSEKDNLSVDFFVPCLRCFSRYDRAAGYFTSSALRSWAAAMEHMVDSPESTIRLLITSEDKRSIAAIHARKSAAAQRGEPWSDEKFWMELSRIYKKAEEKPKRFAEFLEKYKSEEFLKSTVIFVEDKEFGERLNDIIIRHTHHYSQYYDSDKPLVLERFAKGDLKCLVTCHKLSQGIDIQTLRNIILFSSTRGKRETIQRLGRCLRKDPDNKGKIARVVDFYLVDDDGISIFDSIDSDRNRWLTELSCIRPK